MSAKAFFDTNVLVYIVGQRDERSERAEALVAQGGMISVQVLNELVSVSRYKLGMSWEEVREAVEAVRALCPSPVPLTVETHDAGRRIAATYGYRFYDALIAAAALQARCAVLYSEDLQDGQLIDRRLVIRNPFGDLEGAGAP
jgi:predicted nucleic acid-binding protein